MFTNLEISWPRGPHIVPSMKVAKKNGHGHFRNRFIGGTDSIYVWPIFAGLNFREYPHNSYGQTYGTNVPPSIGS